MKANRKFRDGEEAVSAVIGVILMVAITVAIAATVYVYVSGMIGTGTDAAPTLTLTKEDTTTSEKLTVVSADPSNLEWGDLTLLIDGVDSYAAGTGIFGKSGTVAAGDIIYLEPGDNIDGDAPTVAYTVSIRHEPTNTLIYEEDFVGNP